MPIKYDLTYALNQVTIRELGFEAYIQTVDPTYGSEAEAEGATPKQVQSYAAPFNTTQFYTLRLAAMATDGSHSAIFEVKGQIQNLDGTVTLVGNPYYIINQKTNNGISLQIAVEDNIMLIKFVGLSGKTFTVKSSLEVI